MNELLKAKSKFRKKGITLVADKVKSGAGGSWKFAGEDNLIKTIQEPLIDCGLEIVSTMSDTNDVKVTLWHIESGEHIESSIKLPPVSPRKDRNGNDMYLDAEIERGKQFGYWSRILTIRILGLSDVDPEDTNNRPVNMSDDVVEMREKLNSFISKAKNKADVENWIFATCKVRSIEELNPENLKFILNTLKQKSKNANTKS